MQPLKELLLEIANMNCASCVAHIEQSVQSLKGIDSISVNFTTGSVMVRFDPKIVNEDTILATLRKIGYPATSSHKHSDEIIQNKTKKEVSLLKIRMYISICFTLPFAVHMILHFWNGSFFLLGVYQFLLASVVQFFGGWPFYVGSYRSLQSLRANMDSLIALGTSTSYLYSTFIWIFSNTHEYYYDTSAMIISLVLIGKMLEKTSKLKAQSQMKALLEMQPKQAKVYQNGQLVSVPIEQIQKGDLFAVQAGEKIPVDGKITNGASFIDESMLTGESIPVEKKETDLVFAGTINGNGFLKVEAIKVSTDTALSHIIEMVEKAQNTKTPIQKLVDQISGVFVPVVLSVSLLTFFTWWLIFHNVTVAMTSSVAVLIIACPCALGLATPIVIMVATTQGAKHGILIKNAEALEKAKKIDTIIFDKTGTITAGKPEVSFLEAKDPSFATQLLYSMAKRSSHPASKAFVAFAQNKQISELSLDQFEEIPGKGVSAQFENHRFVMGSLSFFKECNIDLNPFSEKINTTNQMILALGMDQECIALVFLQDPIKEHSKEAVDQLKKMGIFTVMLTGDRKEVAKEVAEQIHVDDFKAEVLPQDKSNFVQKIKEQQKITGMVGDGINDAPALATSDVAFAVAHGTDVAMENADIALMKNSLLDVVKSIHLSFLSSKKIKQNLFFAFFYNSAAIPLAAFGLLNPIIAAGAMALSSVSVIFNALLLQKKKL